MSRKLIYLFTDETGSDDVEKESGLAMGTVLIKDFDINQIYKAWKDILRSFSFALKEEVKFLHAIDITNGLQGKGKYKFLVKDKNLMKEINKFFEEVDFDIIVTLININEYNIYLSEIINEYYQGQNIQVKRFNNIFYIVKLRHFAFTLPYVLEEKFSFDKRLKIIHKIEQKVVGKKERTLYTDIEQPFSKRLNSKFRDLKIKNMTVTKEDSVIGLQIADFVIGPIKRCYIDHECERRDFKIIKDKLLYVDVLDKENLLKFLGTIGGKAV